MQLPLRIGVLGVGHLGKIHVKCIKLVETLDLIGFYDPNEEAAIKVMDELQVPRFENLDAFWDAVDVVDIVTPTTTHFALAKEALLRGKHVFIEKPVTRTIEEAEELIRISKEKGCTVQVGHVERFNPALLALGDLEVSPRFIEAHRLSVFNPRGTDVSVVLDLMIHDLDIILSVVRSAVKNIHANGVSIVSDSPDIANVRLEFENGCVANITASRLSLKQMRKVRLFQHNAYISLDFLEKNAQIVRLFEEAPQVEETQVFPLETGKGKRFIQVSMPEVQPVNAIKMELETFAQAIQTNSTPPVPIEDGYKALKLAYEINEVILEGQNEQLVPGLTTE